MFIKRKKKKQIINYPKFLIDPKNKDKYTFNYKFLMYEKNNKFYTYNELVKQNFYIPNDENNNSR
jgi:hypothetical protein